MAKSTAPRRADGPRAGHLCAPRGDLRTPYVRPGVDSRAPRNRPRMSGPSWQRRGPIRA